MSFAFAQDTETLPAGDAGNGLQEAVQGAAGSQELQDSIQNIQMGVSLFQLVSLVLVLIGAMKMFKKAGVGQWKAFIPIYNLVVACQIGGVSGWHVLGICIPIFNIYSFYKMSRGLSRAFGKGGGFTAGLFFLPFIFVPILGFGSAEYRAPVAA